MVARVRNLTSSSSTAEYFHEEGGYYTAAKGDREAARAKAAEHRQASAWYGQGAAALRLKPGQKVSAGTFETILQGHVIGTNIRLGRKRDGKHEHRPGFDITFSAPKSVSLAALLPTRKHPRGDRGVLRCHDEAVKATLDWIEETKLQTRGYDPETRRRPRIKGHGMAAALFRHIASRNLDPQLHTHAVVANMTRDGEGRWKSIEPTELHRNAILFGAYYRDQLARRLIAKGYSVVPAMAGRMRSFEIAGYDRRTRIAFSSRREEMEAYMDEKGWDYTQAAAQIAALATRKRKAEPLHAMLRTIWAERAQELGEVPVVRRSWRGVSLPAVPSALKIAWQAMRHLEERQSVFAASHLEAIALGHSPGRHTLEDIRGAIARLVTDAHLVEARLRNSDRSFVTDRALKAERAVFAAMKAGIGNGMALTSETAVAALLPVAGLTEGQEEAVRTILLTPDRIVGVQGRAGTGKTTMLRHVRELAGKRFVMGLAPSRAAARVLERETGMPAETLQWFLARCRAVDDGGPVIGRLKQQYRGAVLVLDEASMVSTDQMKRLMQIAEELEIARLVLAGDRKQLRAVEAGQPFRLLQKAGMATAEMNEILRQREPKLRAAVNAAQEGEPGEAVELLGSSVHEVPWDELGAKAAEVWLSLDADTRAGTLLVAPTHDLRAEINAAVREALAAEGMLRGRTLRIERLVGLGMTRAEMADVRNYREGDTVLFNQDQVNYRIRKDEPLAVTGIEEDRLLLLHPDGRPRHVAPHRGRNRYRIEVYETRPIEIRAGDRIRWTRNDRSRDLVNGEQAEVAAITKDRVRFLLAGGRKLSLRHDDPQLRHLDHAWSSTVHGAQGSTADGVIAVLDSGHGALTDQSTFYVEISRARDSAVVLTDNCEQLVEVLEAHTGERATALEAVGEEIGPDVEVPSVSEQLPVWSPREDWTALEEKARNEGTILFRVEGYGDLIDRTRGLVAEYPDLPASIREVADGLLAYDRNCREGDGGAAEFLGLLDLHFERRTELEREAAENDCPLAELEDYPAWRERTGRLTANGRALLEDTGVRAGEAGRRAAERLEDLDALLVLDDAVANFETVRDDVKRKAEKAGTIPFYADGHGTLLETARALSEYRLLPTGIRAAVEEVIAEAAASKRRREEIAAFRDETAGLVEEHDGLEVLAGGEPPTVLEGWQSWAERAEAADGRWQAMLDKTGVWRPHLDRFPDDHAAIAAAVGRLAACRDRDKAWESLAAEREKVLKRAGDEGVPPFYLEGWAAFAAQAKAFSEREDLPEAAAGLANRILKYDRDCREARGAVEGFLEDARRHGRLWYGLRREAERRRREEDDPNLSMAELPGYGPLSGTAPALRKTGEAIRDDGKTYGMHLDRLPIARARIAAGLKRLEAHEPLDRFVRMRNRLAKARAAAEERNVLPFHDPAYGKVVADAGQLAKDRALEAAARRRLREALDEQAARAAEWARVQALLRTRGKLETRRRRLEEEAERQDVPLSLLAGASGWRDANAQFVVEARLAFGDPDLLERGHWRSRPQDVERIGAAARIANERRHVPEADRERIAEMTRSAAARLRDPGAEHDFSVRWRGGKPLVEGDRLRLRRWRDGAENEAVVVDSGWSGGRIRADTVTLRWLASVPGHRPEHMEEEIRVSALRNLGVRIADWSHERLREVELARQCGASTDLFPLDCKGEVFTGDLLRWAELLQAQDEERQAARRRRDGLPEVVHFEGRLLGREASSNRMLDLCRVEVSWRSDGGPLGERRLPLGQLTGRGCWRSVLDPDREEQRREQARVETTRIEQRRRALLEQARERHLSMTMRPD